MRKVIIALAILVICAAVSYSFEDLTGFLIREGVTSVVITPDPQYQGTPITIFINTGTKGAKKYLTIHKYPSSLRRGITFWCKTPGGWLSEKYSQSFKCKGIKSVNFRTNTLDPGSYFVRIYDYKLKDYVTEPFEICARGDTACMGLPSI